MYLSHPQDMIHGLMYVVLGPIYGILLLIPTIPLEALFLKLFFDEDAGQSFFISSVMNITSAMLGVVYVSSFAFIETDSRIGWPVTFVGTLVIEFIVLVRMIDPRISRWKILLFDFLANLASYIGTFVIYFILVLLAFALPNLL